MKSKKKKWFCQPYTLTFITTTWSHLKRSQMGGNTNTPFPSTTAHIILLLNEVFIVKCLSSRRNSCHFSLSFSPSLSLSQSTGRLLSGNTRTWFHFSFRSTVAIFFSGSCHEDCTVRQLHEKWMCVISKGPVASSTNCCISVPACCFNFDVRRFTVCEDRGDVGMFFFFVILRVFIATCTWKICWSSNALH